MKEIAIVGAGIGGLTAAHALRQAGFAVRVFERAPELRALGAGITMQANAMEALASLGLARRVRDAGHVIARARIASWTGKTLQAIDFEAMDAHLSQQGVAIHRRRLMEALAEGLEGILEFGLGVEDITNLDGGVRITFDDKTHRDFEAVIGCDGLHSAVRRSLFGEEPLRYAGYTSWRGVASMSSEGMDTVELWGAGLRFGVVPLAANEVYWFAVAEAPRGAQPEGPVLEHLRATFKGWDPQVLQALNASNEADVIATDCLDRTPINTWGEGRVTLLGDAAHPMMPNLGQGGCQAVESAVVLGRVLQGTPDVQGALREYERLRIDRANLFVKRSFDAGRVAQWRNPVARGLRDMGMRLIPERIMQKTLVEQYGFEGWFEGMGR